ncbi:unnamed protein product, partial [Diabrotica balteata]
CGENIVKVPIFRNGTPLDCSNYRKVTLISHASKIQLHVIHK